MAEEQRAAGTRFDAGFMVVAALAAAAGVVRAALQLHRAGYTPVSDNAAIALRAQDVFSRHPPLVGMPSTLGSYAHGHGASHLGPLEFFALAPAYAAWGRSPTGLLVGVALVNVASIAAIVWACRRAGGPRVAAVAAVAIALLVFALGTQVADVWNPNVALLPFAAFVMLVVALANDVLLAFPLALLFGSYALQAHLSYLGLVGAVTVWAIAMAIWRGVHRRPRILVLSAIVLVVCWWAPVVQQFTGASPNFTAVFDGFTTGSRTAGPRFAARWVGHIIGLPPPFGMRAVNDTIATLAPASTIGDVLRFVVPWVVVAAVIVVAWRRRERNAVVTALTAVVLLAATTITVLRTPTSGSFVFVYNMRWLWPAAMVFWVTVVIAVWQLAPARVRAIDEPRARWITPVAAALALLVTVWPHAGLRTVDAADMRLTRRLSVPVVAAVHGRGTYVVRSLGGTATITVAPGLAVALERHGVHTYLLPPLRPKIAPWGEHRLYDGQPVTGTVWVVTGPSPSAPTATARRVATRSGATAALRAEYARLATSLRAWLARTHPAIALDGHTRSALRAAHASLPRRVDHNLARYEALTPVVSDNWYATVFIDGPPSA